MFNQQINIWTHRCTLAVLVFLITILGSTHFLDLSHMTLENIEHGKRPLFSASIFHIEKQTKRPSSGLSIAFLGFERSLRQYDE